MLLLRLNLLQTMKKIIEKKTARIRSARYAEKRKIDSLYNQKFRNIGVVHSIE